MMLVLAMLVPLSLATSNLQVCMFSLFLLHVSEEEKGGVIGLSYSISSVSRMLGPSAVGLAQEVSSELSGYLIATLLAMAVLAMLWFPLETKRHGNGPTATAASSQSTSLCVPPLVFL